MANRFFNPDEQFCDTTGLPYAGGSLTFQASGTSTPLATYSDRALTIANTNPVVLDSAGRAGAVFLQNLAYKVILTDVNNNTIWTADPVYSSDFSTTASFLSGAGSPNGNTAGSQGTPTVPASVYWDNVNNILYVCTQTGNAATAVWTAVNSASAAAVIIPPQGYLTPTSGTPINPGDIIGSPILLYTPYVGNLVPIYNGSSFNPTTFSELTLTLSSSNAASTVYDVFIFNNSGVLTLATGPAWSSTTSRGTGAGTSQISRVSGLWVNTVSITGRNSSNTYTISANQATYLGSIYIDATPGQITLHRSYGQSRKWAVWNAYNRQPITLQAGDATASWTVGGGGSGAFRPVNGNTANSASAFIGLDEEPFSISSYLRASNTQSTSSTSQFFSGIGFNSTSSASGLTGTWSYALGGTVTGNFTWTQSVAGNFQAGPTFGVNTVTALEAWAGGAPLATGGIASNMLTVIYRG